MSTINAHHLSDALVIITITLASCHLPFLARSLAHMIRHILLVRHLAKDNQHYRHDHVANNLSSIQAPVEHTQ